MSLCPKYEWKVDYLRRGSTRWQTRIFQTEHGARRFITKKLRGNARPELEPIAIIHMACREVGEWELVI